MAPGVFEGDDPRQLLRHRPPLPRPFDVVGLDGEEPARDPRRVLVDGEQRPRRLALAQHGGQPPGFEEGARRGGGRPRRTGDHAADRGQHPGGHAEIVRDQRQNRVEPLPGDETAVPVQGRAQVCGAARGQAAGDLLGDGREPGGLRHPEQRNALVATGFHEVRRYLAVADDTRGQPRRARSRQGGNEGRAVVRAAVPMHSGQHEFPAGEVAARIAQVRGDHPAHEAIQVLLADHQIEPELVHRPKCLQPHASPRSASGHRTGCDDERRINPNLRYDLRATLRARRRSAVMARPSTLPRTMFT